MAHFIGYFMSLLETLLKNEVRVLEDIKSLIMKKGEKKKQGYLLDIKEVRLFNKVSQIFGQ